MRSYYNHLKATRSIGEEVPVTMKPTFRSSAIFPVIHNEYYSSKILFMGYWLLKRKITEIGLLYTLRNNTGAVLARKYILVDSTKAFSIEMNEFVDLIPKEFFGTLELEIFSTKDLVFPYPAFVLVYYGDDFSTAVHTTGRIYNDIEDLHQNQEYQVRESGFDIYADERYSPFIAITNGPMTNERPLIDYEVNNSTSEKTSGEFILPTLKPFETVFIELRDYIDLKEILRNGPGSIKIGHNFQGIFPRFVAGNFDRQSHSVSITHTFYDSSTVNDAHAYWNRKDEIMDDSSVGVPLFAGGDYFTTIAVYPIFSPSDFTMSFAFYDENGHLLKYLKDYTAITSGHNKYEQINLKEIANKEHIDTNLAKTVRLVCNWKNKDKIPTRVKLGLNVGTTNTANTLPSNICFAPQLGNPKLLEKPGSFHWAPIINIGKSEIVITNSSPLKEYDRSAQINLTFHREEDAEYLSRELTIPPNGSKFIDVEKDAELSEFLNGKSGWIAAQANNPFVNGYYFDFFESGAVAADHLF